MKKFLTGILTGAVLFIPITVYANHEGHIPIANTIYEVGDGGISVAVFDDAGNKCYVAYEYRAADSKPSISCLEDK